MTAPTMPPTAPVAPADELQPADLRLLLGAAAGDLLRAVAATAGGQLAAWRPRQVNHQPRRSTVVQYRADMTWPKGATTSETFVAATGDRLPRDGAAIFDDGSTRVAVWRWPTDPFLPGLPDALDPSKVAALLDELGIDGGTLQLRTRSYRPGRRAVIEATGRRGRLFLKVVRPAKAEALHHLHRQLAVDLPVPESLGWSDSGVVVLAAKPGVTLREALRSSRHGVPSPEAVAGVLDRLPSDLAAQPARRDLLSSAEHHAAVIAATVPEVRDRLDGLVDRLRTADTGDAGPVTAVHGDLYEAQLLVSRGAITGLLDVDTVGAGLRADDLANFCAHLSVLALGSDRAKPIKRYGAALLTYAEQHHHPGDLRRRISAAVVGLATGPFRVQESNWALNTRRRLDLAAEWLDGTERRG